MALQITKSTNCANKLKGMSEGSLLMIFMYHEFKQIPHHNCNFMLALSESQLSHAFFFSIKKYDFDHAEHLLFALDAPVNSAYFTEQDHLVYTTNLLVGRVAQIIKKYGLSHSQTQQCLKILQGAIKKGADLRCHCIAKNPHYCAISQALKQIKFNSQQDLFIDDNLLILKLLYHGATYKNLSNSKDYLFSAIAQLGIYLQTTPQSQVIELVKMNRHQTACRNRHSRCGARKHECTL